MSITIAAIDKYRRFAAELPEKALVPVRAMHLRTLIEAYDLVPEMLCGMDEYFMSQPVGQDIMERVCAVSANSPGKPDSSHSNNLKS